jgi:hypothetical protein
MLIIIPHYNWEFKQKYHHQYVSFHIFTSRVFSFTKRMLFGIYYNKVRKQKLFTKKYSKNFVFSPTKNQKKTYAFLLLILLKIPNLFLSKHIRIIFKKFTIGDLGIFLKQKNNKKNLIKFENFTNIKVCWKRMSQILMSLSFSLFLLFITHPKQKIKSKN